MNFLAKSLTLRSSGEKLVLLAGTGTSSIFKDCSSLFTAGAIRPLNTSHVTNAFYVSGTLIPFAS